MAARKANSLRGISELFPRLGKTCLSTQGAARIRTQVSAAHSRADLEFAIRAFADVKRELAL